MVTSSTPNTYMYTDIYVYRYVSQGWRCQASLASVNGEPASASHDMTPSHVNVNDVTAPGVKGARRNYTLPHFTIYPHTNYYHSYDSQCIIWRIVWLYDQETLHNTKMTVTFIYSYSKSVVTVKTEARFLARSGFAPRWGATPALSQMNVKFPASSYGGNSRYGFLLGLGLRPDGAQPLPYRK